MSMTTTIIKVDDLDGKSEATQTIDFAIDGGSYEIDLTDANAQKLRDALAPFAAKARRSGRPAQHPRPTLRRLHPDVARDIRVWVRNRGGSVESRGRIPEHLITAYFDNDPSLGGTISAAQAPDRFMRDLNPGDDD